MLAVSLVKVHHIRLHRCTTYLADGHHAKVLLVTFFIDELFLFSCVVGIIKLLKGWRFHDLQAAILILIRAVHVKTVAMHLVNKGSVVIARILIIWSAGIVDLREDLRILRINCMQPIYILSQHKSFSLVTAPSAMLQKFGQTAMTSIDLLAVHKSVEVMIALPRCHRVF